MNARMKLLTIMSDGEWHSNRELNQLVGWSFKQIRYALEKEYGIDFERKHEGGIEYSWRIIKIPSDVVWKGQSKIRKIKQTEIKIDIFENGKVRQEVYKPKSFFQKISDFFFNS